VAEDEIQAAIRAAGLSMLGDVNSGLENDTIPV
jgi:hypothetical protein